MIRLTALVAFASLCLPATNLVFGEDPPIRPEVKALVDELATTRLNFRRVELIRELGSHKVDAAVAIPLLKKLRQSDDVSKEVRDEAVTALKLIDPPKDARQLLRLAGAAKTADAERAEAITELGDRFWQSPEVRGALKELAEKDESTAVRHAAARELEKVAKKQSSARLARIRDQVDRTELTKLIAAGSADLAERSVAMEGLVSRFFDQSTFKVIEEMSKEPGEVGKEAKAILKKMQETTRPRFNGSYRWSETETSNGNAVITYEESIGLTFLDEKTLVFDRNYTRTDKFPGKEPEVSFSNPQSSQCTYSREHNMIKFDYSINNTVFTGSGTFVCQFDIYGNIKSIHDTARGNKKEIALTFRPKK